MTTSRSCRGKASRRWRVILSSVAVVPLVAVAMYIGWRVHLGSKVRAKLEEIRQSGYPVTVAELEDWFPRPEEEKNAAVLYAKAIASLPPGKEKDDAPPIMGVDCDLPPLGTPIPRDRLEAISRYLDARRKSLEHVAQGARLPCCRFPAPPRTAPGTEEADVSDVVSIVAELFLHAVVTIENGDTEGTLAAIETILGILGGLSCEPGFAPQLVRMSCHDTVVDIAERVFSRKEADTSFLDRMGPLLEDAESADILEPALVSELCEGFEQLEDPATLFFDHGLQLRASITVYAALGRLDADRLSFLRFLQEAIEVGRLPVSMRATAYSNLDERVREMAGPSLATNQNLFASMLVPSIVRVIALDLERISRLRAASTAVGVERFRQDHGRLPETLARLTPQYLPSVPADPFGDGPLRYRMLDAGYRISSVGKDGVDQSGEEAGDGGFDSDDVTFTVAK